MRFVVLFVLLTGCTKRQQDFAWFATAVALEVASYQAEQEARRSAPVAVAAPNPDYATGPSQADLERAHRVAMELTATAAHDARFDNCDAVASTSKHVRVIDPDVFVHVFLEDAAIQRCLATASVEDST